MLEITGVIGGVFIGGFLYVIGMMIFFFLKEVFVDLRKSIGLVIGGLLILCYFTISFIGTINVVSSNPIFLFSSVITFIYLLFKFPWWKD